jgi:SsrA-binding protein
MAKRARGSNFAPMRAARNRGRRGRAAAGADDSGLRRAAAWENARMAKHPAAAASHAPTILNRKALHKYEVLERHECGILLKGPEVKSLRLGRASLDEAYARFRDGELWLLKMHIDEYRHNRLVKLEPARPRKLLLHAHQLAALGEEVVRKGLTLVPLKLTWNERGVVKVEIGLVRGKKLHDKREAEKKRTAKRDMDRVVRRGR